MSDIMKALRRPFHRWHDPDKAVYVTGLPHNDTLKVCDVCGKVEILERPQVVTWTVLENLERMRGI